MFNKIAGDRMQIELFFADQLVPTGELFQAMQRGNNSTRCNRTTTNGIPNRIVFVAISRRPRYSPDVPVLFNQWFEPVWDEEYLKSA
jgi:hypothetical protein